MSSCTNLKDENRSVFKISVIAQSRSYWIRLRCSDGYLGRLVLCLRHWSGICSEVFSNTNQKHQIWACHHTKMIIWILVGLLRGLIDLRNYSNVSPVIRWQCTRWNWTQNKLVKLQKFSKFTPHFLILYPLNCELCYWKNSWKVVWIEKRGENDKGHALKSVFSSIEYWVSWSVSEQMA